MSLSSASRRCNAASAPVCFCCSLASATQRDILSASFSADLNLAAADESGGEPHGGEHARGAGDTRRGDNMCAMRINGAMKLMTRFLIRVYV